MKSRTRIRTLEELWELEARYPFSAGNPLCQNAYVSGTERRRKPSKTSKPRARKK